MISHQKKTIAAMIELYCRQNHGSHELCAECRQLLDYALARLDGCPYGEGKGSCRKCTTHCYRPDMRQQMRVVMRYSGPRMISYHPIMAIRHIMTELFR